METVKDTAGDTVAMVKCTFDLHYQVEQHPWLIVGGATVVGYLLGSREGSSTPAALSTTDTRLSPASTTK